MSERDYMQLAFRLARRAFGKTSPNPLVGAVLVKNGTIIGRGWHHRAGAPHAEIEALNSARGTNTKGATLFVSLEPCSTRGRTPPCTQAIIAAGIKRVVIGALDPNPAHAGRALALLKRAGIAVSHGLLAEEDYRLNESFRHWIVHHTPFVTVKAAMSLDGKIATRTGQSKWITGPAARAEGMKLRIVADAILVGVNTIIADDPQLTIRKPGFARKRWQRIVLDPRGRIPLTARVLTDEYSSCTTVCQGKIDLPELLAELGRDEVTSLLVEGGGETNASFLLSGLAHRIAFFYAPIVLGGASAPKSVAGSGLPNLASRLKLSQVEIRRLGEDLFMTARVEPR